ncbi:MAG TPA: hypothetical protein VN812_19250 [Candidatus Acidoferrales bacterium]|nr:hypothetical protein [Candidatus Acidoferrales bacterium]
MKRFLIGFVLGVGLMYWYLQNGADVESQTRTWFQDSASKYRDDQQHRAAREALGEGEKRP